MSEGLHPASAAFLVEKLRGRATSATLHELSARREKKIAWRHCCRGMALAYDDAIKLIESLTEEVTP